MKRGVSAGAGGRHLGLRARSTVAFACLALLLSSTLAVFSYQLTRRYLVAQRERSAERQAFGNARTLREALRTDPDGGADALSVLQTSSSGGAVVRLAGEWFGTSVALGQSQVPSALARRIGPEGGAGRQRLVVGGEPYIAIGVPIIEADAQYFEFVPLAELERTLATLERALLAAAVITTTMAAAVGAYASGRVLRPVEDMAAAAALIGEGSLERLDVAADPDLEPLVTSFNGMVSALQQRIDRERRFASDVSHELRTPLAAMAASLSVARRQATGRAGAALDELDSQVDRFTALVLDLLEISRAQAGVAELQLVPSDLGTLAESILGARPEPRPRLDLAGPAPVVVDRRRIGQVLANLLDNADHYAGGAVAVGVGRHGDVVQLCVDDAGPGVVEHERDHVFERFARGERAGMPDAPSGTGLGLALVAEHVRLHGGRTWVEVAPGGGARFVVELPAAER